MIGYNKLTYEQVRVVVDLTTTQNFELSEESIDLGGEVVVTAERQLVQKDKTSKLATISQDEIVNMPVQDLTTLLQTQSNISVLTGSPYAKSGYEIRGLDDIRMRGGRNNEVALLIDGMAVSNPIFGGFATRVNNFSINQMSVAAGGFDASYGNALSGVVNVSTREGGNIYSGQIQYNTSRPFGIDAFAPQEGEARNNQAVEMSISGPVPGLRNLSFFITGDVNGTAGASYQYDDALWDDNRTDLDGDGILDSPTSLEIMDRYALDGFMLVSSDAARLVTTDEIVANRAGRWINPLDYQRGWNGLGFNNAVSLTTKLTYRLNLNMKVSATYAHSQTYSQTNGRNARYYYHWPVGQYMYILPARMNPLIQPQQFIDDGSSYSYNQTGMASRSMNFRHSQRFSLIWTHNLSPNTFYSFSTQAFRQQRKTRQLFDYSKKYRSSWNIFAPDWDNVKHVSEYNFSDFRYYDPWETYFYMQGDGSYYEGDGSTTTTSRLDFTSQATKSHQIKTGFEFRYIDLKREDYQGTGGVDQNPTIYRMFPKEGSLYLTDKVEFSSIIFNLGLRMDYSNAGGSMWADPLDPLGTQIPGNDMYEYNSWETAKKKFKFSPRFGVAFPLTDKSVVHFNFGHFYQNPNYRDLYRSLGEYRELALVSGGNAIIGNPSLESEKSIQFELGLQQQLGMYFSVNVNMWLKETTNQVGSIRVNAWSDPGNDNPFRYSVFLNNNFGSAKGVDVSFRKRYSHYVSGSLNYTYSKAMVLQPTSWDGYWDGLTAQRQPKREQIADWDQPHVVRARINFNLPRDFGPEYFGFKPLSTFGFTLMYYGESGRLYTPTTQSGSIRESNSARWPFFHRLDGRFLKTITIFGLDTQAFADITNLIDRTNTITGYTSTGSATDWGTQAGNGSATYYDGATINNFDRGRGVNFGFRIRF
jgi:outer membrane receptor for ferrienterochelin and colicin